MARKVLILILSITTVSLVGLSFCKTVWTTKGWMDPVTGSLKRQSSYFGVKIDPVVEMSELEVRLRQSAPAFLNQWQFLSETEYNLWGQTTLHGCGRAPEIYTLRTFLSDYVRLCTDDELERFVNELRSNDVKRQQFAVNAAVERVIQQWQQ